MSVRIPDTEVCSPAEVSIPGSEGEPELASDEDIGALTESEPKRELPYSFVDVGEGAMSLGPESEPPADPGIALEGIEEICTCEVLESDMSREVGGLPSGWVEGTPKIG